MILSDLPSDLLGLICSYKSPGIVLKLWRSGDRQCISKLCNGSVAELYLRFRETKSLDKCRMPGILRYLRLRSLKISWRDCTTCSLASAGAILRKDLSQVWSGLESLEIIGTPAGEVFSSSSSSSAKKIASHLKGEAKRAKGREYDDNDSQEDSEGDWNMAATHPHLKKLILWTRAPFETGPYGSLNIASYDVLPRSLTHLDLAGTYLTLHPDDCIKMPPQLRTLILPPLGRHFHLINKENIGALPSRNTH